MRAHLIPVKYEETGIHFISAREFTALTADAANANAHMHVYAVCLELVRRGEGATAGRSDDGLFTFINAGGACLAVVEHQTYGEGRVLAISGAPQHLLTITFPQQTPKHFDSRWAPLVWRTTPDAPRRRRFIPKEAWRFVDPSYSSAAK